MKTDNYFSFKMRSIILDTIKTIDCQYEINDVVENFKPEDIEWINDYPLYFQNDLFRLFWR